MESETNHPKRLYCGIIWCNGDEQAGQRFEIYAVDLDAAHRLMEEQYGADHVFTLYNPEDADKPR